MKDKFYSFRGDTRLIVICIVGSALGWCCVCGLHGMWMDRVEGRFHDDCLMCDTYKNAMFNDAAFQIRELRRN